MAVQSTGEDFRPGGLQRQQKGQHQYQQQERSSIVAVAIAELYPCLRTSDTSIGALPSLSLSHVKAVK
jgi:hypothetical protein